MEYLDLPMEAQIKLAEYDGMTREEYIKHLDYLANETMEQFDERMKNMPSDPNWTEEKEKAFVEKMSSGY